MEQHVPRNSLERTLLTKLDKRFINSTLRKLTIPDPATVDFSSNDFLSLSRSTALRQAFQNELTRSGKGFPLGSGGSRLLDGNSAYAINLENDIAAFHGAPAALLWNSGFDANCGFFGCVPQQGDIIVYDELIHASVHDGMKLSRAARCVPFDHNCMRHLRIVLTQLMQHYPSLASGDSNIFIAVESVYSMDGDLAPLHAIIDLIDDMGIKGSTHLIVDEAHATGVLGPQGRGLVSRLKLEHRVFARLHTFGKSLACGGAAILCTPLVKSYLINYARSLIYTTFLPFPNLAAIRAAYSLLQQGETESLAHHLRAATSHLHTSLLSMMRNLGQRNREEDLLHISTTCPQSPIFSLQTEHARGLAKHCQDAGFTVRAVVPPTVPTRRVRVCLHAGNTFEQIDGFVKAVEQWLASHIRDDRQVSSAEVMRPGDEKLVKARL